MNDKGKAAFLAAAALALAACSRSLVKGGKVVDTIEQQAVHGSYLEAIGIGASDPALPTDTQRKALARDAAIVKAQYEMLSMVKGVELEGGISVSRAIEQDSTLQTRIQDAIRGAEIAETRFTGDGGAVVTLRLPKKRLEKLMGVRFK